MAIQPDSSAAARPPASPSAGVAPPERLWLVIGELDPAALPQGVRAEPVEPAVFDFLLVAGRLAQHLQLIAKPRKSLGSLMSDRAFSTAVAARDTGGVRKTEVGAGLKPARTGGAA